MRTEVRGGKAVKRTQLTRNELLFDFSFGIGHCQDFTFYYTLSIHPQQARKGRASWLNAQQKQQADQKRARVSVGRFEVLPSDFDKATTWSGYFGLYLLTYVQEG